MKNLHSGASEDWGKSVLFAAFMCLDTISEKDDAIKILSSQYKKIIFNM